MKLVYIHIGKTGGTALRTMLAAAGIDCSAPFVQTHMTVEEARRYAPHEAICGHISRADQVKWYPDRPIITTLREPIDRCMSFIHYIRRVQVTEQSPISVVDAHRLPILDLLETWQVRENVHNTMVRQLGGHMVGKTCDLPAALDAAKETLRQCLWVGFADALDIEWLGAVLGRPLTMSRENITKNRPPLEAEDPRVIARLYELNGYDLQLWNWARHHAI